MIVNEPPAQCPFCKTQMAGWLSRYPAKACDECERPLFRFPSIFRSDRLTIISVLDVAKVVTLPLIAGAMLSFGMGRLSADSFAQAVAAALLLWGMIDVWDGTAGIKTGIDRVKKQIKHGRGARKMSFAKTIFGISSTVLGAIGLLLVS
ncbi:MAG: hypothetical protein AAF683_00045 [Pseudomonadota bacterium]